MQKFKFINFNGGGFVGFQYKQCLCVLTFSYVVYVINLEILVYILDF